ncbi:hypothetical protein GPECTOR_107g155 [Gonium pectorale]|uniref:Protease Do-like PDZ domain-containing protein n=1 Tax=Gonium pectorale TaxID=33097 RepID=A0A150G126_GONPE|nr:hypothetical protein GPECTOR_107g155 [Gonium pectorale]|eukprot:KXZ43010.1 hypothetical protein GPECTOR_107g155 [Gonium pectorale]
MSGPYMTCWRMEPGWRPVVAVAGAGAEARAAPAAAGADDSGAGPPGELLPGVVRVQCVQDLPRFDMPLLLGSFRSSTCNAVAVSYCGVPYLLAPAASVAYGSQIRVFLPGRDKPFAARLAHLGYECELAALELAGGAGAADEFWASLTPYELAPYGLPYLQQPVSVVSYAEGQPRPRAAPGTVMRTEIMTYPSAMQRLLGVSVAVSISKEHIGSPLVDDKGACLGVVYSRTAGARRGTRAGGGTGAGGGGGGGGEGGGERWGAGRRRVGRRRVRGGGGEASASVVAAPVVAHFLEDIKRHGSYQGFPTLGIQWRRLESPALRKFAGMAEGQTGIAIVSVNPTAPLGSHAGPLDVLTGVGGQPVGDDGTVSFRGGAESINISYHVSQFQVGDTLELTLLRGGQPRTVPLRLSVPPRLLPLHLAGRPPSFAVLSGLLLTPLSAPFLEGAFGRGWAVRAPTQLLREWHNHPAFEDEQVVVVAECQDLGPGSATDGYERRAVMHQRVVRCNGVPVRNLEHMVIMAAQAIAAAGAGGGAGAAGGGRRGGGAARLKRRGGGGGGGSAAAATAADAETGAEPEAGSIAAGGPEEEEGGDEQAEAGAGPGSAGAAGAGARLVLELSNRMLVVLPVEAMVRDTAEMLAEYQVAHPVSEDLRPQYERALGRRQQLGGAAGGGGALGAGSRAGGAGPRGQGGAARPRAAAPGGVAVAGGGDAGRGGVATAEGGSGL